MACNDDGYTEVVPTILILDRLHNMVFTTNLRQGAKVSISRLATFCFSLIL